MNPDPIQDFILKDEQNLRIASAVSEAWPVTRAHIASNFLDRLSTTLLKELPGWTTGTWEQFFAHNWPSFQVFKESWGSEYWVALQALNYGATMQFGVQRNHDIISDRPFSPDVLEAVQTIQPSARTRQWWEALVPMRMPASDWQTPNVMWRMYTDKTFLDSVSEQMLAVARATESILDRLTQK